MGSSGATSHRCCMDSDCAQQEDWLFLCGGSQCAADWEDKHRKDQPAQGSEAPGREEMKRGVKVAINY